MSTRINCVLYARVSTAEQAEKELSIPAQLQAMREYAARQGWNVIKEFIEPGVSAKTTNRPALQALLSMVRDSKVRIGAVLVHKIDRLARNVYDHATIRALLQQRGVRLASCVENVDETVSGQLVENIMASIAQFYSANLSDEVRKGMRQKVVNGGWPHRPPRGYIQVRHDDGQSSIDVHPKEGPLMRRAFELYATGHYSLKGLAGVLAREGIRTRSGHPVAAQYLRDLLTNPFYSGCLRWSGLTAKGSHPPLISETLFEQVQTVLARRYKQPGAKAKSNGFPLRGIAICASCRGHMTACWQRSARFSTRRWGYYRCTRRIYNKSLCPAAAACPARKAHADTDSLCRSLRLSDELATAIIRECERRLMSKEEAGRPRADELRRRRKKLVEQEMRLTQFFLNGDVTPEVYKTTGERLRAELREIAEAEEGLDRKSADVLPRIRAIMAAASTVGNLRQVLTEERQAELLRIIFQNVGMDASGVVGTVLNPPFHVLLGSGGNGRGPSATEAADEILESINPVRSSTRSQVA